MEPALLRALLGLAQAAAAPTSPSRRNWPPGWPRKRASGRLPRSSTTSSSEARCGWCTSGSRMSAGSTCRQGRVGAVVPGRCCVWEDEAKPGKVA